MMIMMEEEKKKQASVDGGSSVEDKLFSALKNSDKEAFKKLLRVFVKEIVMDLEMQEDDKSEMDF
jgi:hypothetical protein